MTSVEPPLLQALSNYDLVCAFDPLPGAVPFPRLAGPVVSLSFPDDSMPSQSNLARYFLQLANYSRQGRSLTRVLFNTRGMAGASRLRRATINLTIATINNVESLKPCPVE